MEPASWDAEEQFKELNARKRTQESSLSLSGSVVGVLNVLLLIEVLSVNEDANTFLLVGLLGLTISASWLAFAKRAGAREMRWERQARVLEKDVLLVPEALSVWYEAPPHRYPAWISVAGVLASFCVVWAGLLGYAVWTTYLAGP